MSGSKGLYEVISKFSYLKMAGNEGKKQPHALVCLYVRTVLASVLYRQKRLLFGLLVHPVLSQITAIFF